MGDMLILSVGILFGCVVLYEGCKEIKKANPSKIGVLVLAKD